MFRLLRLIILVALAFVAGAMMERNNSRTDCIAAGGDWRETTCYLGG